MAIELLEKNIAKISDRYGKGNSVRKTVTSTNDGAAVALYSSPYSIAVASWRISNPADGATVNYRVLASKENQPAADSDSWDEIVESTELTAGAVATDPDNEGAKVHHTAIMVVVESATNDTPSTVRVALAGSV